MCPGDPDLHHFDQASRRCYSDRNVCTGELTFPSFEACDQSCDARSLAPREYKALERCTAKEMQPIDDFFLDNEELTDEGRLVLDVIHRGGCGTHMKFRLCYDGVVHHDLELPSVRTRLIFDHDGGICDLEGDVNQYFSLEVLDTLGYEMLRVFTGKKTFVDYSPAP